jgi:hypothetical protein
MGRAAERGRLHDGGYVVKMTLEEAMHISDHLLPGEPGGDELANWRAAMPTPEPPKRERGLDTMQVDLGAEIRKAVTRERALITEAAGQALAEVRDAALDEAERLIAAAVAELRAEFAGQLAQLRSQADTLGGELKAQLEQIIARKRRAPKAAKANGDTHLPGPNGNGNAHPQ